MLSESRQFKRFFSGNTISSSTTTPYGKATSALSRKTLDCRYTHSLSRPYSNTHAFSSNDYKKTGNINVNRKQLIELQQDLSTIMLLREGERRRRDNNKQWMRANARTRVLHVFTVNWEGQWIYLLDTNTGRCYWICLHLQDVDKRRRAVIVWMSVCQFGMVLLVCVVCVVCCMTLKKQLFWQHCS